MDCEGSLMLKSSFIQAGLGGEQGWLWIAILLSPLCTKRGFEESFLHGTWRAHLKLGGDPINPCLVMIGQRRVYPLCAFRGGCACLGQNDW